MPALDAVDRDSDLAGPAAVEGRKAEGGLDAHVRLAVADQAEGGGRPGRAEGRPRREILERIHTSGEEALQRLPEVGRLAEIGPLGADRVVAEEKRDDPLAGRREHGLDRFQEIRVEEIPAPAVLQEQPVGRGEVAPQGPR